MSHGRMAAEASNQSSSCSELHRFMVQCAALLGLPAPAPMPQITAGGRGGGTQLVASAKAFLQQVEAKRQAVEVQLREAKTVHRCGGRCSRGRPGSCTGGGTAWMHNEPSPAPPMVGVTHAFTLTLA